MNALIASIALLVQWGSPPADPHDHHSPDGQLRLHVESIERGGKGPGIYSMFRGDVPLWSLDAPFHLVDVFVSKSGQVFGCGDVAPGDRDWEMVVALIGADGELLHDERTTKKPSGFPDTPSNPRSLGLVPDPAHDRIWVRIADPDINAGKESWWGYRLSTGERLGTIQPAKNLGFTGRTQSVRQATAVPGTDLILVHWWITGGQDSPWSRAAGGSLIALLNPKGELVWKLALPLNAKAEPGEAVEETARRQSSLPEDQELILGVTTAGQFEVADPSTNECTTFRANFSDGAWSVEELARSPWLPSTRPRQSAGPARVKFELELVATTELQDVRRGDATTLQDLNPERLYKFGPAAVLGNGRISLQDLHTGALHSWNESGERLATGRLPVGKRERLKSYQLLVPGAEGETWAQLEYDFPSGSEEEDRVAGNLDPWVRWKADGAFVGSGGLVSSVGLACVGARVWTWDYSGGARVFDKNGAEFARLEQALDKSWLDSINGVSTAPDGRAWIWEGAFGQGSEGQPAIARVLICDENCAVEQVWPIEMEETPISVFEPQHRGPWILPSHYKPLLLTMQHPGAWRIWEPADLGLEGELEFGLSTDGTALLVVDGALTLRRYALPDPDQK